MRHQGRRAAKQGVWGKQGRVVVLKPSLIPGFKGELFSPVSFLLFCFLIQPTLYKVQFNGYHAACCITVAQMLFFCNVA